MKKTLGLILLWPISLFSFNCRPQVDVRQPQYLVGYGSLMNSDSAHRSSKFLGNILPIWLYGYQRGFYLNPSKLKFATVSTTFLGIVPSPSSRLNAVAIKMTKPAAIHAFDQRERSYCRVNVKLRVKRFSGSAVPGGQYWVYVAPNKALANEKYPIVESYVDLFVSACLQIQKQYQLPGFATQCIKTTKGWSRYWVNDRIYPRRPWIYQPKAFEIDRLLKKNVPLQYSQIRIE